MDNRPKICFNKRLILRKFFSFLSDLKPFITSHHPDCGHFKGHYIVIRGTKLCIGCFFTFTTAVVVILFHVFVGIWRFIPKDPLLFILAAVVYLALYVVGIFGRNMKLKIVSKIVFGFIFVVILIYIYELPYTSDFIRIAVTILVFMMVNYVIGGIRSYKMLKVCDGCAEKVDFPFCSGFKAIINKLIDDGFVEVC